MRKYLIIKITYFSKIGGQVDGILLGLGAMTSGLSVVFMALVMS
jgi:hypothetical protein